MTLQFVLDQVQANGWDTLRGAVTDDLHTMPPAWLDAYDDIQALAAQVPPAAAQVPFDAPGTVKLAADLNMTDWRNSRDQAADRLLRALGGACSRADIIEQHLAPVLGARLAVFAEDVKVIGPHAVKVSPDDAVVDAAGNSRDFADAWLRFTATGSWYLRLRQSWAVLRRGDLGTGRPDPLGDSSILAEVRNAPEVQPDDWRNLRAGGQGEGSLGIAYPLANTWPVPVHVRLAAILRDGGQVWLPSVRQQWAVYQANTPEPEYRPDLTHPLKRLAA